MLHLEYSPVTDNLLRPEYYRDEKEYYYQHMHHKLK